MIWGTLNTKARTFSVTSDCDIPATPGERCVVRNGKCFCLSTLTFFEREVLEIVWGHPWPCSGLSHDSVLKDHFWWDSGNNIALLGIELEV